MRQQKRDHTPLDYKEKWRFGVNSTKVMVMWDHNLLTAHTLKVKKKKLVKKTKFTHAFKQKRAAYDYMRLVNAL